MHSRRGRYLLILAGVTALYVVAGKMGLALAFVNASTSAVWPPAGIAVAALLLWGMSAWPAVSVGAFIVNVTTSGDVPSSLMIAAGNTIECVVAVYLTNRFAGGRAAFDRGLGIFQFTALGAVIPAALAATIGTIALRLSDLSPPSVTGLAWLTWWLGDAIGIVLFTPLLVLWPAQRLPLRASPVEAAGLVASVALVLIVVFGTDVAAVRDLPLAFLMVPILIWAAFRFDTRITATMCVLASFIGVYRILHQYGPLSLPDPAVALLVIQTVVSIISVMMLAVSAEMNASRETDAAMRALASTLEERVRERTDALSKEHLRLAEAQEVAHVGSWEWEVARDSLWWSAEMCRIFGVTEPPRNYEEYLSRLHPDDRERTHTEVVRANDERRPFSFDHKIVRPDGSVRVLHARGRVELDADGRPIRMLGIGHDITERKRAEEERAELIREQIARREAEDANQAKDAFLATLSHELRTPLNAALGWTHILREAHQLEGREARALQAIYRNLLIQSRLVSDILDISRIAKGGLSLDTDVVDLSMVVDAAVDMVRESANAKGVTLEVETAGAGAIVGDAPRLQQVCWNLLSNAVKFAADGGRVAVTIVEEDDDVALVVKDDGPGIDPEFLPHVFERFSQADSSVTRAHGGLGLGLAIAHHIVHLHLGTIEASNGDGRGAVFTVRLPRQGLELPADRVVGSQMDRELT
jgi:PAS domain S-box-containing protein